MLDFDAERVAEDFSTIRAQTIASINASTTAQRGMMNMVYLKHVLNIRSNHAQHTAMRTMGVEKPLTCVVSAAAVAHKARPTTTTTTMPSS